MLEPCFLGVFLLLQQVKCSSFKLPRGQGFESSQGRLHFLLKISNIHVKLDRLEDNKVNNI